jgi:rRNA processing protein Krr1/Pno1
VTDTVLVPISVRPHLLGAGGKNLKALTVKTGTKINVPRQSEESSASDDIDESQPVTITGDFEGVKMAKSEIESIVTQRVSFHPHFLISFEKNKSLKLVKLNRPTN